MSKNSRRSCRGVRTGQRGGPARRTGGHRPVRRDAVGHAGGHRGLVQHHGHRTRLHRRLPAGARPAVLPALRRAAGAAPAPGRAPGLLRRHHGAVRRRRVRRRVTRSRDGRRCGGAVGRAARTRPVDRLRAEPPAYLQLPDVVDGVGGVLRRRRGVRARGPHAAALARASTAAVAAALAVGVVGAYDHWHDLASLVGLVWVLAASVWLLRTRDVPARTSPVRAPRHGPEPTSAPPATGGRR
jgi:hypothetical protein